MTLAIAGFSQEPETNQEDRTAAVKRFEIGGQFTFLNRRDRDLVREAFIQQGFGVGGSNPFAVKEFGIGVRLGYNLTNAFAIEAEANVFPTDKTIQLAGNGPAVEVVEPGGRKLQMQVGPKFGYRGRRIGVFGKARPGFIKMDRFQTVTAVGTPSNQFVLSTTQYGKAFFTLDVGAVFELYTSKRTFFRLDVGDTMITYRSLSPNELNRAKTLHNFQNSIGFGFRF